MEGLSVYFLYTDAKDADGGSGSRALGAGPLSLSRSRRSDYLPASDSLSREAKSKRAAWLLASMPSN